MFCLKCGKILPSGTTVCPGCNTPVPNVSQNKAQVTDFKDYSSSDYRQDSSSNDYRNTTTVPQPPPMPPVPNVPQTNAAMVPPPVPNVPQTNAAMVPPPVPVQTPGMPNASASDDTIPQPLKPLPVQPASSSSATSASGTPLYGKSEFGAYQPDVPREAVNDHLVMSIITMACCCMPAGIGGLIFSLQSRNSYSRGDISKAAHQAKTAYWFNLIGIIVGLLQALLVIIGNIIAA